MNPLQQLGTFGQSPWLDYIRRNLMSTGELDRLIREDGLMGMTSNPAIFEKAITASTDYSEQLVSLQQQRELDPMAVYEALAIPDIQAAADAMRGVYESTGGRDGYVSLEVSPFLAHDTQGTLRDARRLWATVNRPNVMIKVPGTAEGIPAIEELTAEGINVNVTLLFSQAAYEAVARAYLRGLQRAADPSRIASVASFFISRIDSAVDKQLKAVLKNDPERLRQLKGKTAIANAKIAYQLYKQLFSGPEWEALRSRGARPQRLLWASTGTKDPDYSDVMYVDELIGPDTVNTIPPATFDAYRDHGRPSATLEAGLADAQATMEAIAALGIRFEAITAELVRDGVKLFAEAFDKLLNAVDAKCKFAGGAKISQQTFTLPVDHAPRVQEAIDDWRINGKVRRLWSRDESLWTNSGESKWLDWLGIVDRQLEASARFAEFAAQVKAAGFTDVLLLGMGGSSLCPDVLRATFGRIGEFPRLHVLDSTDPAQVAAAEAKIEISRTLFIVASKSGSTLEPNIFKQYFFDRAGRNGAQFVAITDPGSQMEQVAKRDNFGWIFHGVPSIGGRYSALSDFGMIPAAAMGIDVADFLDRAEDMVVSCSSCLPPEQNPGVMLGIALGTLAKAGRDKLTLVASPGIGLLGAWLEQLIAESTGKQGKAIIPVDQERLRPPDGYGADRVFCYLRLETGADAAQDAALAAIEAAGHPVIRIAIADARDLGQEFFRWEIATAVAGSILGINPFDQPDVEASKIETKKLTTAYEETGSLPEERPFFEGEGVRLFADAANAAEVEGGSLKEILHRHLERIGVNNYFALLAYVEQNAAHEEALAAIRESIGSRYGVATCLGFGPRFLHSTGQAYKGGPNTGVFLQVTAEDKRDLKAPGQKYTFGVVKAAQARGDFAVLAERGRRALRVHLGPDAAAGLRTLAAALQ
ncbi:MAG: bifunctional transaldolase/phosoglucose isomerase [Bryobacteraceae bacterium]|nr:bifunctional transaldolase/phosoglucose isomerase [Bryobacteraceae bacterium]